MSARAGLSWLAIVMLLAPPAGWSDPAPKHAGEVFQVEISVDAGSLQTDFYQNHGVFFINTTITNLSDRDQEIIVWTQPGWSWVSDNTVVHPGIEAQKNFPTKKTLHSQESYSAGVEMFVDPGLSTPVIFRLGFCPRAERPVAGLKDVNACGGLFWSNPVTLPGKKGTR